MTRTSEYAAAGVDYSKIEPFKDAMIEVAKKTINFPKRRHIKIDPDLLHAHGAVYEYTGNDRYATCVTLEGLGNENWIAELLYARNPEGPTYHDCIAYDTAMMAVNDCLAQGALPFLYMDEVAASDSDWFANKRRAKDFGFGLYRACRDAGMALGGGESPAYKYLVNPRPPVKSAAVFSGCVAGIIAPIENKITGRLLQPGDRIIGVRSSGIHANGISLIIRRVMGEEGLKGLPDEFDTRLPSGMTIGQSVHIPTLCYVPLIERLLMLRVSIHALLPGTGDGVGKLGFDKRPFLSRIHSWPEVPELFLYMRELGVSLMDCLKTFNWGVGYYIFVAKSDVNTVLDAAEQTGLPAMEVGVVEEGRRGTVFGPEGDLFIPPPGE